jgi:hypothetical protein
MVELRRGWVRKRLHRCTTSAVVVLALAGCDDGSMPDDDPAPLDQLPLAVALEYVAQHPEFVIADPDAEVLMSEPPTQDEAELDRRLAGDWVARKLSEHPSNASNIEWARVSVDIVRDTLRSQRSPGVYIRADECTCERGFEDAEFARLVRGLSNCDGINYTLERLLSVREPETVLVHLDGFVDGQRVGGHTLTTIPGDGGPIFVDAWADYGLMVLSAAVSDQVTTYDEIAVDGADDRDGVYPRELYEHPLVSLVDHVQEPRGAGPDLTIPDDLPPIKDARDAYLRARVFDLYGLHDEALPLYRLTAELSCEHVQAPLCQLANAYLPTPLPY